MGGWIGWKTVCFPSMPFWETDDVGQNTINITFEHAYIYTHIIIHEHCSLYTLYIHTYISLYICIYISMFTCKLTWSAACEGVWTPRHSHASSPGVRLWAAPSKCPGPRGGGRPQRGPVGGRPPPRGLGDIHWGADTPKDYTRPRQTSESPGIFDKAPETLYKSIEY